jgi:hypothetical protein
MTVPHPWLAGNGHPDPARGTTAALMRVAVAPASPAGSREVVAAALVHIDRDRRM